MRGALAAAVLVAFSVARQPAFAANAEDLRSAQVRELSKLFEIPRGLDLAAAKVLKSFQVEGPPEVKAKTQAILREVFAPMQLRLAFEATIAESADSAVLAEAIRFRKSPLAQKLLAMEEHAQTTIATDLKPYAASLSSNPPPPPRLAIVQRIVRATRHVETAVAMSMDPLVEVGVALGQECGGKGAPGADAAKLRDLQANQMRQSAPVVMLFLYRAASDAELSEYAEWFESQPGQKFVEITTDAIGKVLNDAAKRAGRRIGREVMKGNVTWCP